MGKKIQVVHYLNQFFAGLGGEEFANAAPQWFPGAKGPGQLLSRVAPEFEVVATVMAGDNYMAEDLSKGVDDVFQLLQEHLAMDVNCRPELLIAGPAFNAGRYGMACAAVCQAAQERLNLPALTALYPENPAAENYRQSVTIVRTADSVLGMQEAIERIAKAARKRLRGETLNPAVDHTLPRGIRENYFAERNGASRAIQMLVSKLAGKAFETEYAMPVFDRVPPAAAIGDMRHATLALITSGGIVPKGNPDRIESASASKFGAYPVSGLKRLEADSHQSVHGGYDTTYANQDPNRVLPLDVARELEAEGRMGPLHETYYATVGNATSVRQAIRFGKEIAAILVNQGVQAAILTST